MLDPSHRHLLLTLSRQSIVAGLRENRRVPSPDFAHDGVLDAPRASFVTLRAKGHLRGCCGTLEPQGPLAEGVWRNAWAAAFSDPRFAPLSPDEYPDIDVHISVLSPLESLPAMTEQELLRELRPDVDGLLLQRGAAQATFLPAVWEQVSSAVEFVRQLKLKAGWTADFWAPDIVAWRYTAESFGEH
ncbi:AmmeMemoRadiSam system protein A [Povalibacter sp.]|uniref:AmmeMemoRadiSam system protein A n=1 Tax=Povalibacter sp. TaxID=1962978 RepID=UPI002F3F3409